MQNLEQLVRLLSSPDTSRLSLPCLLGFYHWIFSHWSFYTSWLKAGKWNSQRDTPGNECRERRETSGRDGWSTRIPKSMVGKASLSEVVLIQVIQEVGNMLSNCLSLDDEAAVQEELLALQRDIVRQYLSSNLSGLPYILQEPLDIELPSIPSSKPVDAPTEGQAFLNFLHIYFYIISQMPNWPLPAKSLLQDNLSISLLLAPYICTLKNTYIYIMISTSPQSSQSLSYVFSWCHLHL